MKDYCVRKKQKLNLVKNKPMKPTHQSSSKAKQQKVHIKQLVLMNDDFNSIDHVIDCLEAICDHDVLQAEQCALLTHYKGKYEIMSGNIEDLMEYKEDLFMYGLQVNIV